MPSLIEEIRDILTVRKLALEVKLDSEHYKKIDEMTQKYLEALLPK